MCSWARVPFYGGDHDERVDSIEGYEKAVVKSLLFVLVSLEIGDGKERRASPSSRSEA